MTSGGGFLFQRGLRHLGVVCPVDGGCRMLGCRVGEVDLENDQTGDLSEPQFFPL